MHVTLIQLPCWWIKYFLYLASSEGIHYVQPGSDSHSLSFISGIYDEGYHYIVGTQLESTTKPPWVWWHEKIFPHISSRQFWLFKYKWLIIFKKIKNKKNMWMIVGWIVLDIKGDMRVPSSLEMHPSRRHIARSKYQSYCLESCNSDVTIFFMQRWGFCYVSF